MIDSPSRLVRLVRLVRRVRQVQAFDATKDAFFVVVATAGNVVYSRLPSRNVRAYWRSAFRLVRLVRRVRRVRRVRQVQAFDVTKDAFFVVVATAGNVVYSRLPSRNVRAYWRSAFRRVRLVRLVRLVRRVRQVQAFDVTKDAFFVVVATAGNVVYSRLPSRNVRAYWRSGFRLVRLVRLVRQNQAFDVTKDAFFVAVATAGNVVYSRLPSRNVRACWRSACVGEMKRG
jgi:hypothetical protein